MESKILPETEIFLSDFLLAEYSWKSIIKTAVNIPIIPLDFIVQHA
jgi:hypothetical protein